MPRRGPVLTMQQRLLSPTLLLLCAQIASSKPFLGNVDFLGLFNRTSTAQSLVTAAPALPDLLVARQCINPCGFYTQLCCGAGGVCYTDANNEAQCSTVAPAVAATAVGGYWQYYTSAYVETDLVTKTVVWSTYIPAATICATTTVVQAAQTAVPVTCNWAIGESSCGNICCSKTQYCLVSGQCAASANTKTYSAPLRVTASTLQTVVETVSPTITVPFESAVVTGTNATIIQSSNQTGLSAGAIAGIVIGVIAAVIILLLLCIIFCFRAAWDGLMGVFGIGTGGRRRREVVEVEEYHGSRSEGRRWVEGGRPSRPERKRGGNGLGWGTAAAALGGLAVLLGMRNDTKKRRDEKSEFSSSSGYYDSEYSSSSSDRRTRDTRRSRG